MKERNMAKHKLQLLCLVLFCATVAVIKTTSASIEHLDVKVNVYSEAHVHFMSNNVNAALSHTIVKRTAHRRRQKRDAEIGATGDSTCKYQETVFLKELKGKKDKFSHMHTFNNETKASMALTWAGKNDGVIIMVTTEEFLIFAKMSNVYRSTDDGRSFIDINSAVNNAYIRKNNGLQKHPLHQQRLYLVAHTQTEHSDMWWSDNGGANFTLIHLPLMLSGVLVYHPSADHMDWMLAVDGRTQELFVTKDAGVTWVKIKDRVENFKWSTSPADDPSTIYVSVSYKSVLTTFFGMRSGDVQLCKSVDLGQTWTIVHEHIYNFGMQGKFLYASVRTKLYKTQRLMEVSTTGGKVWSEAQLPVITSDRFYSILDMSEGLIFVHVDNPGDTGHGTLYTSDATGVIFSESLKRHLYPNFRDVTDFYRVRSMRSVYLASQLESDKSIHTVITFDRGATWQPVKRPAGVVCKDESKACYLQIHNMYSVQHGVRAAPPMSVENAVGIILVHGHVADALQTTVPDIYVTSDGGYTWTKALDGPHAYQIADQGGLLVAVPLTDPAIGADVVKFSTDEGRCWHEYKFAPSPVVLTGLLTEPGGRSMAAAIWGYHTDDRQWRVYTIDFAQVIPNKCYDVEYVKWVAHFDNSDAEKFKGCVLGIRETFMRLKKDSWCRNGHAREMKSSKQEICDCMKDDYGCDYGYARALSSQVCVKDKAFKGKELDICLRGHEEKVVTIGYHKIPGDKCQHGFQPAGKKLVNLNLMCAEGDKHIVEQEMGITEEQPSGPGSSQGSHWHRGVVIGAVVFTLLVIALLVGWCTKHFQLLRRIDARYQYSTLISVECDRDAEQSLLTNTSLFDNSDDEDVAVTSGKPAAEPLPKQNGTGPARVKPTRRTPHVASYHDDSDVDMLE